MSDSRSDAFVFFGSTGDLAYKKIFPALYAMAKRGTLNVPVIGVGRSAWSLDQFRARAYDSLEKHGEVDHATFDKLCCLLRYVSGDNKILAPSPPFDENSVPASTRRTILPSRQRCSARLLSN